MHGPQRAFKAAGNVVPFGDRNQKSQNPKPRGTAAVNLLQRLRPDGPWVLTAKTFTDPERARRFIAKFNRNGWNIYYSLNRTHRAMSSKASKADIAYIDYLHVDADPDKDETPKAFKVRIMREIEQFDPMPTFIVVSGNGLQLLFRLQQPGQGPS